jgi:hypothetical protein
MSLSESDRQKLDEMLTALYDGSLDDDQTEELLRRLDELEVRNCFAAHAMLDAYLSMGCAAEDGVALPGQPTVQFGTTRAMLRKGDDSGARVSPRKSAVLGFLSNLTGGEGWKTNATASGYLLAALTAIGLILSVAVVVLVLRFPSKPGGKEIGQQPQIAAPTVAAGNSTIGSAEKSHQPQSAPIARLARVVECRWADQASAPRSDDILRSGSELRLASGIVELKFEIGVRAVVQGPARLDLLTPSKVFLYAGKMTSEVLKPEARGFEVRTPQGSVVDLGTEFGVEVTPAQNVKVHVFKGEVRVEHTALASAAASSRVIRNQGLRMDNGSAKPVLVEDSGENFIRTIDDADRKKHVVAYWRFEDRPLGVVLPDTRRNTRPFLATADSSYNGNDLFTFSSQQCPQFCGDVEAGFVPQTGAVNRGCLDNTAPPDHNAPTRDVYSHSQFSYASPIDLQAIKPAEWTIEASIKVKSLQGRRQTFIVRDGGEGANAAQLAFRINENNCFEITFKDIHRKSHKAVADEEVLANQWYNLAAVSDGRSLKLYIDSCDGRGYLLCGTTNLKQKGAGSTALGCANADAEWSVGRGCGPSEWFQGWIDEVRISDIAREPGAFLFTPRSVEKEPKRAAAKHPVGDAAIIGGGGLFRSATSAPLRVIQSDALSISKSTAFSQQKLETSEFLANCLQKMREYG